MFRRRFGDRSLDFGSIAAGSLERGQNIRVLPQTGGGLQFQADQERRQGGDENEKKMN
jgi:hypothetical protein